MNLVQTAVTLSSLAIAAFSAGTSDRAGPRGVLVEPQVEPIGHEFTRGADGLFRVTAYVNETPVEFIVDTGATTVVLTGRDAARAGLSPTRLGASDTISTAAGASPMRWARLNQVEVAGRRLAGIEAAVIDRGIETSLLGQNVLAKLGTVTLTGSRLRID